MNDKLKTKEVDPKEGKESPNPTNFIKETMYNQIMAGIIDFFIYSIYFIISIFLFDLIDFDNVFNIYIILFIIINLVFIHTFFEINYKTLGMRLFKIKLKSNTKTTNKKIKVYFFRILGKTINIVTFGLLYFESIVRGNKTKLYDLCSNTYLYTEEPAKNNKYKKILIGIISTIFVSITTISILSYYTVVSIENKFHNELSLNIDKRIEDLNINEIKYDKNKRKEIKECFFKNITYQKNTKIPNINKDIFEVKLKICLDYYLNKEL
jgi:uncharacterized RDD family membrane protein YckC